jgi:hypothetical protein
MEAYITWPGDREPDHLLNAFHSYAQNRRERVRVAHIFSSGYLLTHKENGRYRDAVLKFVREFTPEIHAAGLPVPPPWMGLQDDR